MSRDYIGYFSYLDRDGNLRGPFSRREMCAWYQQNYFPADLVVFQFHEKSFAKRTTLADLIDQNGRRSPFTAQGQKDKRENGFLGTSNPLPRLTKYEKNTLEDKKGVNKCDLRIAGNFMPFMQNVGSCGKSDRVLARQASLSVKAFAGGELHMFDTFMWTPSITFQATEEAPQLGNGCQICAVKSFDVFPEYYEHVISSEHWKTAERSDAMFSRLNMEEFTSVMRAVKNLISSPVKKPVEIDTLVTLPFTNLCERPIGHNRNSFDEYIPARYMAYTLKLARDDLRGMHFGVYVATQMNNQFLALTKKGCNICGIGSFNEFSLYFNHVLDEAHWTKAIRSDQHFSLIEYDIFERLAEIAIDLIEKAKEHVRKALTEGKQEKRRTANDSSSSAGSSSRATPLPTFSMPLTEGSSVKDSRFNFTASEAQLRVRRFKGFIKQGEPPPASFGKLTSSFSDKLSRGCSICGSKMKNFCDFYGHITSLGHWNKAEKFYFSASEVTQVENLLKPLLSSHKPTSVANVSKTAPEVKPNSATSTAVADMAVCVGTIQPLPLSKGMPSVQNFDGVTLDWGQLEIVLAPYRAEAKAGKPLPYNTVLMDSEKDVAERMRHGCQICNIEFFSKFHGYMGHILSASHLSQVKNQKLKFSTVEVDCLIGWLERISVRDFPTLSRQSADSSKLPCSK